MNFANKIKNQINHAALGMLVAASTTPAIAQSKNAADIATNITGQVGAFMKLAISVGYLFGVVLFVFGLYMLYKDSNQPGQGHAKKGFIGLAVGSALLIAPTLMGVGANSVVEGGNVEGAFSAPASTDFNGN